MWFANRARGPVRGGRPSRRTALFILPFLVLGACSDSGTEVTEPEVPENPEPPQEPESAPPSVILEVEWARDWLGLFWLGFSIDQDGNVWAYDVSERPWGAGTPWGQPPERVEFPAAELEAKWASGRRLLGIIEPQVYAEMAALALDAEAGEYFRPNAACNDAGMFTYLVHRYDPEQEAYTPVVLRQDGNEMRQGQSPEALILGPWLRSLVAGSIHSTMHGAWLLSCASEDWESLPPRPVGR